MLASSAGLRTCAYGYAVEFEPRSGRQHRQTMDSNCDGSYTVYPYVALLKVLRLSAYPGRFLEDVTTAR